MPVRRSSSIVSFQSVSPETIEASDVRKDATMRKSAACGSAGFRVMTYTMSSAMVAVYPPMVRSVTMGWSGWPSGQVPWRRDLIPCVPGIL